jgi:hypothetical protein
MNRNRLNDAEGIGFFITIVFASMVVGAGMMALVGKLFIILNK